MKFSVSLSEFHKAIQKTLPAIPPKSTLPVLEHLHFSLKENKLKMVATDQDITILSTSDVVGFEEGEILVPGRKLNDIIKALGTEGDVTFTTNTETFEIELKTSKGRYGMKGLHPEDYIELPELFEDNSKLDKSPEELAEESRSYSTIAKLDLMSVANKTVFAVSHDEFRPAMTGVLFQFRDTSFSAVSTDSYRLVKAVVETLNTTFTEDFDVIIPARSIDLLKKIDDDAVLSLIESQDKITHVRFEIGNTVVITRVIDEKFPPYESVIPTNNEQIAVVDKKEMLAAIRRVSIFTSAISKQIRMTVEDNMIHILGEDEESGNHANEEIPCDYNGEKIEFGFNHKFLEDALNNIENEESDNHQVLLTFSEPTRPALIKPSTNSDKLLMLIMPVRIS